MQTVILDKEDVEFAMKSVIQERDEIKVQLRKVEEERDGLRPRLQELSKKSEDLTAEASKSGILQEQLNSVNQILLLRVNAHQTPTSRLFPSRITLGFLVPLWAPFLVLVNSIWSSLGPFSSFFFFLNWQISTAPCKN